MTVKEFAFLSGISVHTAYCWTSRIPPPQSALRLLHLFEELPESRSALRELGSEPIILPGAQALKKTLDI